MSKNIRNTNKSVINVSYESPIPYSKSVSVPISWDHNATLLQTAPIAGTIHCERIGDMIFIKIAETFYDLPFSNGLIESDVGVVPAEYRPTTDQLCSLFVINGYQTATPSLNMLFPYNVTVGACILYTDGTLRVGAPTSPVMGPVTADGTTLCGFSGPTYCGLIKQCLMFSAT